MSLRRQIGLAQAAIQLHPRLRPAPALELLDRSMHGRVPALVKLKYELMAMSPFSYFRGDCCR